MRHRATKSNVYASVLRDTEEFKSSYPHLKFDNLVNPTTLDDVAMAVAKTQGDLGIDADKRASLDQIGEAFSLCEKKEDYEFVLSYVYTKCILCGCLGFDHRDVGTRKTDFYVKASMTKDGLLTLNVDLSTSFEYKTIYSITGKVSKVIGKLFGEKFTTHMSTHHLTKSSRELSLHITNHYIPELYRIVSRDEGISSCMSHNSDHYGLDDDYHPLMAYEGSPDAALALLWDESKGRHIARAIVTLDLHTSGEVAFYRSYGQVGSRNIFSGCGLSTSSDTSGMRLTKIDYEGDYLLPFVDGDTQHAREDRDWLVVDEEGDLECDHASGRAQECGFYCNCCEDRCHGNFTYTTDGDVCESCIDYSYVWLDSRGEYYRESDCTYVEDVGGYVHEDDAWCCEYDDMYYSDDMGRVEVETSNGNVYTIAKVNLDEALDDWTIVAIDGESIIEEEEQAA